MTDIPTRQTLADALGRLMGSELSAVTFVRDYVQLAFDGPNINAHTPPVVTCGSQSVSAGQPDYHDSLCRQIGCVVERTAIDDQQVSIVFENGATVSISLRNDDYRGPEVLEFWLDRKDRIWVV